MAEYIFVETAFGLIRGESEGGVRIWRGIPYAAPATGELRFQKPQPFGSWEGTLDATRFGPVCPQNRNFRGRAAVTEMSEDCLTLNIWAAADPPPDGGGKREVFFFIHGGSFAEGAGSDKEYEGSRLAREGGVVVVTINYRLGSLGFLNFSFLGEGFVPNCGLWDMLAALRWVRENISAFGGDPENITVCGQSAGAISLSALVLNEEARGYIRRGIMMSGIPTVFHSADQAETIARRFMEFMQIPDAEALRAMPCEMLTARHKEFAGYCGMGAVTFAPCVDGEFVKRYPIAAALESEERGVPLLIGTTREEMSAAFYKSLSHLVDISEVKDGGIRAERADSKKRIAAAYKRYGKRGPKIMVSDFAFRIPSVWYAEARSKNADTWMYRFDYETFGMRISGLHSFHSSDIPFLFGNFRAGLARYMFAITPVKIGARRMHRRFRGDFLAFVKTGELPWPKCEGEKTPAKCYRRRPFVEEAVDPEVKGAYEGSLFKQKSFAGENIIQID